MFEIKSLSPQRQRWIAQSGIPRRFLGKQFVDLDAYRGPGAVRNTTDWLDAYAKGEIFEASGVGLAYIGAPGHGKTTLAAVTGQALLAEDRFEHQPEALARRGKRAKRPVWFGYYPEILEIFKRSYQSDPEAEAMVDALFGRGPAEDIIHVLVMDDLGKEHRTASGWSENTFDHLFRARFDRGLPVIITTNELFPQWGSIYGSAMASFAHEALTPINVASPSGDRRIKND